MHSDQLLTSYAYSSCFGNTSEQHSKTQSVDIKSEFTSTPAFTTPNSSDVIYNGYPNLLDANSNWTVPYYQAATDPNKPLQTEISSLISYPASLTDKSTDNNNNNHRFPFLPTHTPADSGMLPHPYMPTTYTAASSYQELLDSSVNASVSFPYPFSNNLTRDGHGQPGMFPFPVNAFSSYYSQSRAYPTQEHIPGQDSLNCSISSMGSGASSLEMTSNGKLSSKSLNGQTNKPKRKRIATAAQRRAANIRERRRMFSLNESFDCLRKKVPTFAYEKRLSRIETLRLAITYIAFMTDLLQGKQPQQIRLASKKSSNLLCQVAQQHLFSQQQQTRTPSMLTSPNQSDQNSLAPTT